MGQPAGGEQSAAKRSQPVSSAGGKWLRKRDAGMIQPGQSVLVVKCIANIHGPVDDYFVTKSRAGIYPCDPGSAPESVIHYRGFNASHLCVIGYFTVPVRKFLQGHFLLRLF